MSFVPFREGRRWWEKSGEIVRLTCQLGELFGSWQMKREIRLDGFVVR